MRQLGPLPFARNRIGSGCWVLGFDAVKNSRRPEEAHRIESSIASFEASAGRSSPESDTVSFGTSAMHDTKLDEMYLMYGKTRPGNSALTRRDELLTRTPIFRKFFLPRLPINKDAKILDIGCGCGEFLSYLVQMGYTQTLGIDLNPEELEVARSLGVTNVRQAEALSTLREYRGEFDVISAIDVLEHVPKPTVLEVLNSVHDALRPGGIFLCQVPNLAAFYTPLFYMDFTHETPFAAKSLKQALEMANFNEVVISPMGPIVHGVKSAVRAGLWCVISYGFRFVQLVESARWDSIDSIFTAAIFAAAKKDRMDIVDSDRRR